MRAMLLDSRLEAVAGPVIPGPTSTAVSEISVLPASMPRTVYAAWTGLSGTPLAWYLRDGTTTSLRVGLQILTSGQVQWLRTNAAGTAMNALGATMSAGVAAIAWTPGTYVLHSLGSAPQVSTGQWAGGISWSAVTSSPALSLMPSRFVAPALHDEPTRIRVMRWLAARYRIPA